MMLDIKNMIEAMKKYSFIVGLFIISLSLSSCDEVLDLLSDDPRDAFVGTWGVSENNSLKSTEFYTVTIEKSSGDSTLVFISNFYAIGNNTNVEATVSGGTITVPNQTVEGFTIQGSGDISINDNGIDWNYTVNHNNGFIDYVTATYTKQ
jgi:hypothetical protein